MKIFTILGLIAFITLNSCSSSMKSTSDNEYYSTNTGEQYLKLKTHKRVDWNYFDDYDDYSSSAKAPAPLYHLGIVPFGVYNAVGKLSGAMLIPISYYNPEDFYRDAYLSALDLYNNPSGYLFRYYFWNEFYNPYYFTSMPNNSDIAFNSSMSIYPANQYYYSGGSTNNNNITSLYSGQVRNIDDVKKIFNSVNTSNNNVGSFKNSGNNVAVNKTANNWNKTDGNFKRNDNSSGSATNHNDKPQISPPKNFTPPPAFNNSNNNIVVNPIPNSNAGGGNFGAGAILKIGQK